MTHLKHFLAGAVGLLLLLFAVGLAGQAPGHAQARPEPTPVTVENGPDRPVPVAGSVSLSGRPIICLDPDCVPGVRILDARQAFQRSVQLVFHQGEILKQETLLVPAGKRLVIEQISASAIVPANEHVFLGLRTCVDGVAASYFPIMVDQGEISAGGAGIRRYHANDPVRLYADPDQPVQITAHLRLPPPPPFPSLNVNVSLSGHLVDFL